MFYALASISFDIKKWVDDGERLPQTKHNWKKHDNIGLIRQTIRYLTVEETVEKNTTNSADTTLKASSDNNNLLDYAIPKLDAFFAEKEMTPTSKRKFKETTLIHGIVYKFAHFGVEVTKDQATIFGKYTSEFFDIESYEDNDKLLEKLLPRIKEFYHNPVLTKHPIIRYFSKFKK